MKEGIYFSALGRSSFCFVNRTHRAFLWWWVFWWFKFHNTDLNSKWATVSLDSKAIPDGFRQEELWIWVQQIVLSPQMIPWPLAARCRPAPGWRGCPMLAFHLLSEVGRLYHVAGLDWLPIWELGPWQCFHDDCSRSGSRNNELLNFMTQWGSWMDNT